MPSVLRGSGDSSFGGNLSIEGVLTYEDVSSVDSVGVITARSDVIVGGGLSVTGISTFNGGRIDIGTGTSISSPSSNVLTLGTNNGERLRITSGGNVGIGTDNPNRRLVVTGDLNCVAAIQGATNGTSSLFLGDTADEDIGAFTYNHTTNHLEVKVNDSERLRITSDGQVYGTSSFSSTDIASGKTLDELPYIGNESKRFYRYSTTKSAAINTYEAVFKITFGGGSSDTAHFKITGNAHNPASGGGNIGHTYCDFTFSTGNGTTPYLEMHETVVDTISYNSGFCRPIQDGNDVWIFIKSNSSSGSARVDVNNINLEVETLTPTAYTIYSVSGTPTANSVSDPDAVTGRRIHNSITVDGSSTLTSAIGPVSYNGSYTASSNLDITGFGSGNYLVSVRSSGVYHWNGVLMVTMFDTADFGVVTLVSGNYQTTHTASMVNLAPAQGTLRLTFSRDMSITVRVMQIG